MKLIFITGKQGSGKSYAANVFVESKQANCLDVDKVLVWTGAKVLQHLYCQRIGHAATEEYALQQARIC